MRTVFSTILCCFLFISQQAIAANIETLRCNYNLGGFTAEWDLKGKFKSEKSAMSKDPTASIVTFDQINTETRTARIIGSGGSAEVVTIFTPESLSFIEQTGTGNIILTTVFINQKLDDGSFPVVTSRHINVLTALPQQYYGTCVDQTF